jgi:mono/diheme cytochrome c family protein
MYHRVLVRQINMELAITARQWMRTSMLALRTFAIGACSTFYALGLATFALAQDRAKIEAGEQLYDEHCAMCHGGQLRSAGAMPDLRQLGADARARFDEMVMNGKGQMPSFQGLLTEEQLDQLWAYIRSRARG